MSDNIDRKLWNAAFAGDEALVSQLIDQATVDWRDDHDYTALHPAARRGHAPVVTRLLDAGWSLEARSDGGRTPLSWAAVNGQLETAKCLLLRGANMDTGDIGKYTPLHYASSRGHNEVIKALLHCGANQHISNGQGQTAEDAAIKDETRAVFREFSEKGLDTKEKLFDKAVEEKKYYDAAVLAYSSQDTKIPKKIKEILDDNKIKDLSFLDYFQYSLSQCHPMAKNILRYFNKNTSAFNGNNTLHYGALNESLSILKFSVEHSVNIEKKNLDGNTALHITLKSENENLFKYLIENGSNIEAKNLEGNTPLHITVKSENEKLIKYLIKNGSNVEAKNLEGNTPLHLAAVSDNEKIAKYLIENGASSTQFMKNNDGMIPLELARQNKYIFRIILIDFLNYALKTAKFSSNEFQKQLGSGNTLFCLKRDLDGKTLFEFLNDQGMVKEREELIQLLIKIDLFRFQGTEERKGSKKRVIKILRAGMKPSRGLKESVDSVQKKYSWETGKIRVKCFLSIILNVIFGWSLFGFDVGSDLNFYIDLIGKNNNNTTTNSAARTVTLVHIILPNVFATIFFITLLYKNLVNWNRYLPLKFPLPPFTKLYKTIIECRSFVNNKNIDDSNYEKRKTDFIKELDDQKTITTISMILEASLESSFQFFFQGLFSFPTLVFSFIDVYDGDMRMTDMVNWQIVSIVLSFLSFAFTSFNIR